MVGTDRRGVNRLHGGIVTMHIVILVAILGLVCWLVAALGPYLAWYSLLPFGILVLGQAGQIGVHAYAWGRRSALAEPLIVEPAGFTMVTAAGPLAVPWSAVASLKLRRVLFGRVLTIAVQPGFFGSAPPAGTGFTRRQWRFIQRRGLLLGERGLQQSLDDIVKAMTYFAGRPLVR